MKTLEILSPDRAPGTRRSDHNEARQVLRSAAQHCVEEGLAYSLTRWHGWAEYQMNRHIAENLFEDLAASTDMAVALESGHLDYVYYHFASKAEAVEHYETDADFYIDQILGGF